MKIAKPVNLSKEENAKLKKVAHSNASPLRDVVRARIILLAAEGKSNLDIANNLNINVNTAAKWRKRFLQHRFKGLQDKPRNGPKRIYNAGKVAEIVNTTLQTKPPKDTHWSTRTLAEKMGVSHMTIQRIWKAHNLQPHRVRTFKLSRDPRFVEKLTDVVGLYLNPPEHALVLSVDEKSQIQALDRTQPGLPLKPGKCGTMTHDYKRYGTTTLFAALNVLDGTVIGTCMKRHRHQEYLAFLKLIDRQTPLELDLHLIVDNYSTHKQEDVQKWLSKHPRFHIHFTPTSSSWSNLVERFFSTLTEKCLRRGIFRSVLELTSAIDLYLERKQC